MRFFLINQYSGNKGDRAVLYAMCRLLKSAYPDSQITVSTSDKKLWEGYEYYHTEKINFVPWSWDYNNVRKNKLYWKFLNSCKKYTFTIFRETFLRNICIAKFIANPDFYKTLKSSDIVISVGGHHFTTMLSRDLVSEINFDAMTVLSKKTMICFSQSFGPFNFYNNRNKELTKRILSKCILMPRENKAKIDLIDFIGEKGNIHSTYESVLSLSKYIKYNSVEFRDNAIGISIYCTQSRTQTDKQKYQKVISEFCDYAISKGFSIRFFPMEIKGSGPDDRYFIKEIISQTKQSEKCSIYDMDMETLDHLNEVAKCKIFLGHKTHSTIFALATGTPLIAISYHPKTIEFLQQFNLKDNVIDDTKISTSDIRDIFDRITNDLESVSRHEYDYSKKIANQIECDITKAINSIS